MTEEKIRTMSEQWHKGMQIFGCLTIFSIPKLVQCILGNIRKLIRKVTASIQFISYGLFKFESYYPLIPTDSNNEPLWLKERKNVFMLRLDKK